MSITQASLTLSIENSSKSLLELSNKIKEISFPEPIELTFETKKLNDKYISNLLRDIPAGYAKKYKNTDFIYVFELQDSNAEINTQIYNQLIDSRDVQNANDYEGKKDFCRPIHANSNFLYVGRSQKLKSRLKQHLDAGSEGIFAMHMLRWVSGIEIGIKIYCYQFNNQDNLVIQALEDGLWESFNPMFGRKGEK